jgi:HlyD family secretion protein
MQIEPTMSKGIVTKLLLTTTIALLALASGNDLAFSERDIRKVPVKVLKLEERDFSSTLSLMGTINYASKADVSSEIGGVLSSVNVEEGDVLQKGQVIAVIDSTLLQAQLKQAQASLEMAEIDLRKSEYEMRKAEAEVESTRITVEKLKDYFDTQKKLFTIGGITQSKLDEAEIRYQKSLADYKTALEDLRSLQVKSNQGRIEAEARVIRARADVDEIKARIEKSTIRAPISGIVSSKRKWTGESISINPGDSVIVTIVDTKDVYAEADLNERNLGSVKVGQQAEVIADAYPDLSFTGKTHLISPTIDRDSRTVKVKVKVSNDKQLLKPGMFVRVKIVLDSLQNVVAVPQEAVITTEDGREMVFVIIDEVAFLREVQTGLKRDDWVVIHKGLKVGEKVVVEGQERLRDLTSVKSTEISAR